MDEKTSADLAAFAPVLEAALDGIVVVDAQRRYLYVNPAASQMLGYPREALIGQDFLMNFPPYEQTRMLEQFAASLREHPGQYTTIVLRPDGEEREISYTNMLVTIAGQPCGAAILHDLTEENLRMARERGALIQIAASAAAAHSLDSVLETLATNVIRATGAVACTVVLQEGDPPRMRMLGTAGMPPGYAAAFNASITAGAMAPTVEAARQRQPVILRNARQFIVDQPNTTPLHDFVPAIAWDTIISVPLIYRHRDLGVLNSYYLPEAAPGESEIAFLTAIADQAAIAVENATLLLAAQEKAVLEERQRLARELHDSVSQALFGIALGARTARALIDRDPPRAAEPLDYVLSLAEGGMAEMRALIFELRPESLETEGIIAALTKMAAALRARYHLDVQTVLCEEPDVPMDVKEVLYRITQEALNNIVKHARATRVDLRIACGTERIVLDIQDNGQGFDPAASFPGHLGLRSMRERASRLGGTLSITSTTDAGTHIHVEIPMHPADIKRNA